MNKKIPLIVLCALFCALMPFAYAGDVQKQLVPSLLKYQPVPAEPGNYVDVWLLFTNQRDTIYDFDVEIEPDYPFTLSEYEASSRRVSAIPTLETVVFKYRFFVDIDARNQEYNLTWDYHWKDQGGLMRYDAPISVQATDASLTVDRYVITPHPVRPGANATLAIFLKNNGKIGLKDIDLKLDLSTANSFLAFGTGTVQRIPYIGPGGTAEVAYQLISDPKSETRIHSFPIIINFRDERNNRYNSTSSIAAVVNAAPRLMVSVQESKLVSSNSTGDITLKVVNNGAVDLKFLTLKLGQSKDYDILSPSSTSYLGNLDADDFSTADFTVFAKTTNPVFSVNIEFSDPYNNRFEQEFQVPLKIVDIKSLEGGGYAKNIFIGIAIVVVVIIIWFVSRRFRQSKHEYKQK